MRVHGEIKILDDAGDAQVSAPWRWLLISVAGFLFWSAVIAAARQAISFV